jgi:hypothetical protein
MTPARIAELRALLAKATRGPYFSDADSYGQVKTVREEGKRGHLLLMGWDDGAACAAAMNALPDALDEIERLSAMRLAIGELLAANGCDCDCDCDRPIHNDDCGPCFACRVNAAIGPH